MSSAPSDPPPPPGARLSPFVFPSDTTFRFLLLVVAVVGANLYVWNWIWFAVDPDGAVGYLSCRPVDAPVDTPAFEEASRAYSACVREVQRPLGWWMAGGTALLLAVATAILFVLPLWVTRRRRLRPLTRDEAPAIVDELDSLAEEAGLRRAPRWLWNPLDPSPTGLAFGRPGRHSVALMGGLVTRQIADPPAFRAVVRHELAHLRNRDVDLTYATVSLWYAFVLVGIVPFAVIVADEGVSTVVALGWRLLALTALVLLTRNAVLRAREVYADVRASVPDGPHGALRRILGSLPRKPASAWRRLWRVHPDPRSRLEAVDDTRRLFPLGLLVAFGTGIATTIAYDSLVTLVGIHVVGPLTVSLVAAAPVALLAMGVLGVGAWRGAWGALADARRLPPTWQVALAYTAGFVVGPQLALERAVRLEGERTLLESALGSGAPWIAILAAAFVLVVSWASASAESWIRAQAAGERPTLITLAGLVVASWLLMVTIAAFQFARDVRSAPDRGPILEHAVAADTAPVGPVWLWDAVWDAALQSVLAQPVVALALILIWAFPFAAWLRRRTQLDDAPWAFLDPGGRLHIPLLGRVSLEPLLVGLVVGLVCIAAYVVLRLGVRSGYDLRDREGLGFAYAFGYWTYMLAFAAQTIAGGIAAARARALPVVSALMAAFVVALLATLGIEGLATLAGCVEPIALRPSVCDWDVEADFVWINFRRVLGVGALAALAAALGVVGAQALARRLRAARRGRPAPIPS